MGVNTSGLTIYETLEDALAQARADLEDDEFVDLCRFPDTENFCGNRHNMSQCPHCFHIQSNEIHSNEYFVKIVTGGN